MSNFPIFFVYLYYSMKFKKIFLKGNPPAPPLFEKSGPPAEKKIGSTHLGFLSSPTYVRQYMKKNGCRSFGWQIVFSDYSFENIV